MSHTHGLSMDFSETLADNSRYSNMDHAGAKAVSFMKKMTSRLSLKPQEEKPANNAAPPGAPKLVAKPQRPRDSIGPAFSKRQTQIPERSSHVYEIDDGCVYPEEERKEPFRYRFQAADGFKQLIDPETKMVSGIFSNGLHDAEYVRLRGRAAVIDQAVADARRQIAELEARMTELQDERQDIEGLIAGGAHATEHSELSVRISPPQPVDLLPMRDEELVDLAQVRCAIGTYSDFANYSARYEAPVNTGRSSASCSVPRSRSGGIMRALRWRLRYRGVHELNKVCFTDPCCLASFP